jgi:hypothetical protein
MTANPSIDSITRRSWLKAATAGVLGWSLPECLALGAGAAAAKNVLVILEQGGLSHIDTLDPKPEAPTDHRSPHRPIATSVPGMQFTDLLQRTAPLAHKLAVVRSMYHPRSGADAHPSGTRYILSGAHPSAASLEMPDIGSVVAQTIGSRCKYLPPYVMVPGNDEQSAEAKPGFLPASSRVFKTGGRDVSDPAWKIEALLPRGENQGDRFSERQDLLGRIDQKFLSGTKLSVDGMDRFYEQAYTMLNSPAVSKAFNLAGEPDRLREAYGPGHRGACYMVGRKLIESGVRFVTVDVRWPLTSATPRGTNLNWDHHDFIYAKQSCEQPGAGGGGAGRYGIGHWCMMGSTDRAFAALIEDLETRGLLAETLVCFVTEFGRTPRINKFQGRDHWANGYSIVLAGAGVPGGQVIGRTDREGGHVIDRPYCPEDYATTIYEKLGIDRDRPLYTSSNRPVYFGHGGKPIAEAF